MSEFDAIVGDLNRLTLDPSIRTQIETIKTLSLAELFALKKTVEDELGRLFDLLQNTHKCDLTNPLVTPDGFPRSDVDIVQVRILRRNINMLRNDLKAIIDHCNNVMSPEFQSKRAEQPASRHGVSYELKIPFAVVTELTVDSPSSRAGILVGDKIVKVGNIHAGNHQKLSAVGMTVRQSKDKQLSIRVLRKDGAFYDLTLTPSEWAGPGLLGCRLSEL
ncbi:ADL013Cp [Eremothecium gossypii ATCC 10895]|uniref:Probable 26S proteasome regulatory subunit p27 n=1 Tax=Eremothecium gossypii (strain ATCC 10895 / CBS 109.51 / FGSC 9923 / NRRL Y-1056) TaxID=284811 RepID=Q75AD0_EREGS|nr:ADL013Cp [Eremothecium gossypii ATCC 10895]AAS51908.1 ADL013Cp [Eremothecium gossypii ATCC 10895]AEY96207.1 FADL013Cp [Eremothecium gossypii FDAG1]